MTTIAFDGKTLAADTAVTSESKKVKFLGKIRRVAGGLIGFCGEASHGILLMNWFEAGELDRETGLPEDSTTDMLFISRDKKIILYDSNGVPLPIEDMPFAMGTGGHIAQAFMAGGGTAVDAVRYAIIHDPNSGFEAISLKL